MEIKEIVPVGCTGRGFVSSVCTCNGALKFATFDEEDEQTWVPCPSCGQVWLMKHTARNWVQLPLSEVRSTKTQCRVRVGWATLRSG